MHGAHTACQPRKNADMHGESERRERDDSAASQFNRVHMKLTHASRRRSSMHVLLAGYHSFKNKIPYKQVESLHLHLWGFGMNRDSR